MSNILNLINIVNHLNNQNNLSYILNRTFNEQENMCVLTLLFGPYQYQNLHQISLRVVEQSWQKRLLRRLGSHLKSIIGTFLLS